LLVSFRSPPLRRKRHWGHVRMSNDVSTGQRGGRVAVNDDGRVVMLAARKVSLRTFTSLAGRGGGRAGAAERGSLEAVILDLDAPRDLPPMVELVSQLRASDEDLVLIGLIRSLTKVGRRKLLAAGIAQWFRGSGRFRRGAGISTERARATPPRDRRANRPPGCAEQVFLR